MFFGMIITLEVLFRISEQRQGLVSTSKDNHFYWTYGPTAGMERTFNTYKNRQLIILSPYCFRHICGAV